MLRKKIKIWVAPLVILAIGIIMATKTFSQNYCNYDNWTGNAGAQWWNSNIPTEVALSAEQIANISDIRTKTSGKLLPRQRELQSLRIEYHGYNANPNAEIQKIKSYRSKIRDLEEKISYLQLDARGKINKILTKEQRLYFNNGGYGWWDSGDNWWHSCNSNHWMSGQQGHWMKKRHGCYSR